jgi:hypothetical protein
VYEWDGDTVSVCLAVGGVWLSVTTLRTIVHSVTILIVFIGGAPVLLSTFRCLSFVPFEFRFDDAFAIIPKEHDILGCGFGLVFEGRRDGANLFGCLSSGCAGGPLLFGYLG